MLATEADVIRLDGIINLATQIGMARDKRSARRITEDRTLTLNEVDALYEGNHLAGKIIDTIPAYETQKWARYSSKIEADTEKDGDRTAAMQSRIDAIAPYFNEARIAARKYGGAAIHLGVDDGQRDDQPVRLRSLKNIRWANVLEGGLSYEIYVERYQEDPKADDYGQPLLFRVGSGSTLVHRSRLLLFQGINPGRRRSREKYGGWGVPILQRLMSPLGDYCDSLSAVAIALQTFNRTRVKMAGLAEMLATKQEEAVKKRLDMLDYVGSVMDAVILDTGDEYEMIARNFTNVREMIDLLKVNLGAGLEQPHTTFFNESPSGVTSGRSEQAQINDVVSNSQEVNIRPELERYIDLLHQCSEGATAGVIPDQWAIEFESVYKLSELEEADLALKEAQKNKIYLENQVVAADEMAESIAKKIPISDAINLSDRASERAAAARMERFPEGRA